MPRPAASPLRALLAVLAATAAAWACALPAPDDAAAAPSRNGRPATSAVLRLPYGPLIVAHARVQRIDPAFVAAVVHAESGFDPRAVSPAGARGLMQLMPATARGMGVPTWALLDPAVSIAFGTRYLAQVRRLVGSRADLVAAGYNAGPHAVLRAGGVPPYAETRAYVRRVVALFLAYHGR